MFTYWKEMAMGITRKQYMDGEVTHKEYYLAVAKSAGVDYSDCTETDFMARCKRALNKGDEHLNTIPLNEWDMKAASIYKIDKAFKAHGDFYSMAGGVCLVKNAVIDALRKTFES